MPRVFTHFTFFFFTLTALSGVWMRYFPFNTNTEIPYTNVLHGHSHLAILGWAFLGGFIIYLTFFWRSIKQKSQAKALTITLFITSTIMFIAFLYQGYGVFSIIMSSIHIFVEYWAAIFMFKHLKEQRDIPRIGKSFIYSSLLALLISSLGPFALGYISANGLKDSYFFDLAIYFYLHFQYNGWLSLFLIGLFTIIIRSKNIPVNSVRLIFGFWLYVISLFPSYFLSILWVDLGSIVTAIAAIGSIGQWAGVIYMLFAFKSSWKKLSTHYSKLTVTCLWISFVLLFFKSTMELGLISPTLANLVYDTRSIVIGYLHFTLLGFISIFILSQYQMMNIIKPTQLTINGFLVFLIGFLLNEILLFLYGFLDWFDVAVGRIFTQGLLAASIFLLIGILILWSSYMINKKNR